MFSITTIESSTTRPTATVRAARVNRLREYSPSHRPIIAISSDSGIEIAVMIVERTDSKKTKMIVMAKARPRPPSTSRSCSDCSIRGDWSNTVVNFALCPTLRSSSGNRSDTACEISTESASEFFKIPKPRAGRPSAREIEVRSTEEILTLASWSSRLGPSSAVEMVRALMVFTESGV